MAGSRARLTLRTMLARLRAMDPFRADLLLAASSSWRRWSSWSCSCPTAPRTPGGRSRCVARARAAASRSAAAGRSSPRSSRCRCLIGSNALGDAYVDHLVSPFFVLLLLLYGIGPPPRGPRCLRARVRGRMRRRRSRRSTPTTTTRQLRRHRRGRSSARPVTDRTRAAQPRRAQPRRCARRRERLERERATARRPPRPARSARGSPASCTTSSRTR